MALAFSKLSNLLYLTIIIPLYKTVPSPGNVPVTQKHFKIGSQTTGLDYLAPLSLKSGGLLLSCTEYHCNVSQSSESATF